MAMKLTDFVISSAAASLQRVTFDIPLPLPGPTHPPSKGEINTMMPPLARKLLPCYTQYVSPMR